MSDLGNDLADNMALLQSTKSLQATWQSIADRLPAMEQRIYRVQQTIDDLPHRYIKREEFHDIVGTQHAKRLNEHDEMLKHNNEVIQKLSGNGDKQHAPQSSTCLASEIQKQLEDRFQTKLNHVERRAQDLRAEIIHQMGASSDRFSKHLNGVDLNIEQLRKQIDDGLGAVEQSIREAEHNLQITTEQKVDKIIQILCHNESSPEAAQFLSFISKSLVEPLSAEVARVGGEIDILAQNYAKQEELCRLIQSSQETAMSEMVVKLQDTNKEFEEQFNLCAKKVDADQSKQELSQGLAALSTKNVRLRSQVDVQLNELAQNVKEVRTAIHDHEQCLRHHAEEIDASKDELHRELGELSKIMNQQFGKLENCRMSVDLMRPRRRRRHRSTLHSLRSSADGESSSEASCASPVAHQPIMPWRKFPSEPEESVPPMSGNVEDADKPIAVGESELQRASSRPSVGNSGSDDSSSEKCQSSSTLVLRVLQQQLEAVAMGVLGLAHLVLKEVRLGTSRNARLIQEKEILEELANVRHWITNRVVPSGWDPSKLTTLALRCTHPRNYDMKRPSPQVSHKSLLELNCESRVFQKRNLSSDPRAGAKVLAESRGGTPNKPPVSARGHPAATRLPPLECLVEANRIEHVRH